MFFFVKDNPNEWARKEMNFSRFSPQYNCISWMDNSAASQTLLLFPYSSASNISIEKYSRSLNNEELHTFMYFIYFSISFLQYLKYYTILLTLRLYVTIFKAELPNLFESITFFWCLHVIEGTFCYLLWFQRVLKLLDLLLHKMLWHCIKCILSNLMNFRLKVILYNVIVHLSEIKYFS